MSIINTLKFIINHPLTRDQKLSALFRFVRWQIGSRIMPGEGTVIPFAGEARLLVKPGMTGATGNLYVGLHEFEDMAFVIHFLRKTDFFVDIGANIGSYTVLASKVAGSKSLAIEPIPNTYESLMDNIRLNGIEDCVDALNIGVSREKGELTFAVDYDTTNHVISSEEVFSGNSLRIPVEPLSTLISDRIPNLIKIDVEGFESEVIRGGANIFTQPDLSAVIMELNGCGSRYRIDDDTLHTEMLSFGFKSYTYDPILRRIEDLNESRNYQGNTLYIRDPDLVQKRLNLAKKVRIFGKRI